MADLQLCPCGSGSGFRNCCEPLLNCSTNAESALQLMRSRYTAFTKANVDYLMQTHAAKSRPVAERKNIERWAKSVVWLGLEIIKAENGNRDDKTGYVEFKATYIENGQPAQIHERSLFIRENGKWVYVSGVHLP
jgi:Uncharacterized protein conserved in bacteria